MDTLKVVRIENWSVGDHPDDWHIPPEVRPRVLRGVVYGHPRKPDGSRVRTNNIVKSVGRFVETASGTVYQLGEVDPEYDKWCRLMCGVFIDPDSPLKGK